MSKLKKAHAKTSDEKVIASTGNVFADLAIPQPEQYLAKAQLAAKIVAIITERGLTQVAAGKLLGLPQPKVSALLSGRLDGFSSDRLFRFLNALGCDVQITISKPSERKHGRLLIRAS